MTVNVLGTEYSIARKKYEDEGIFKDRGIDGYCDSNTKEIVVCDLSTYPGWENESESSKRISEKLTLRHEITHAFLSESGLADNTLHYDAGWAQNEEMVDWIAFQGPKIYAAWQSVDAL